MFYLQSNSCLKPRLLALSLSLLSAMPAMAMQKLDDASMAKATGEGVAFVPSNLSLQFNGADDQLNAGVSYPDTGYIHVIPVGPLTAAASAAGAGKGDVYLYGLALSKGDGNLNNRFSGNTISAVGTYDNPWLFKVNNATIPNYVGTANSLSYLSVEAPLYRNNDTTNPDAYNMKLGLWLDAFVRDPSVAVTVGGDQSQGLLNRLRAQVVADGFSLNGTNLKIFQTQGGATGSGDGLSTSYNFTLGLAALVRLNFASTGALRISTAESGTTQGLLSTPAINGGAAPTFSSTEGVTLFQPNINLVLGSLYQPLILGVAPDGRNLVVEVTRIPNVQSIYSQIYTRYPGDTGDSGVTYKGSTCNAYSCGSAQTYGGVTYQGNNATHSSIAIGTMNYDATNNLVTASSASTATGVQFTSPSGATTNLGSATIDGLLIQHLKMTTKGL